MYINTFKYTPKDVSCQLCTEYVKKLGCTALRCPWLAERIEAGVVGYCLCSGQQRTIHFPDTACRSYSVCRNSFSYWNYIYGGLRSLRHKK